jgi:hypothetical protein
VQPGEEEKNTDEEVEKGDMWTGGFQRCWIDGGERDDSLAESNWIGVRGEEMARNREGNEEQRKP